MIDVAVLIAMALLVIVGLQLRTQRQREITLNLGLGIVLLREVGMFAYAWWLRINAPGDGSAAAVYSDGAWEMGAVYLWSSPFALLGWWVVYKLCQKGFRQPRRSQRQRPDVSSEARREIASLRSQ